MPQLNDDGLQGSSANDWLAPVVTLVMLGIYAALRPASEPRRYDQARAAPTVVAFAVNVLTIWPADSMLFALENVNFTRAGRTVLADLNLTLAEGTTALVGPSGAGKSTLLRLLNRLADPDVGTVRYRGRDVRDYDVLELRREVALVPQLPALLPGTVADNIAYGPRLCGRACDVDEALTLGGLDTTFADRPASQLSVGEQQRAMLARALALKPTVLLLDEPTAALDQRSRDAVERTLTDLRMKLSASLIVVTHDPAQARRLSDRIIQVHGGRLGDQPGRPDT
jgi:putative ABC transport system ATP-binding protein